MFGFLKQLFGGQRGPILAPEMKYAPRITSYNPLMSFKLGEYEAILLNEIQSTDNAQYSYILMVNNPAGQACLFVASRVNAMRTAVGGGSHLLGVFPGPGHQDLGHSDDWGDRDKFIRQALKIVREHLGMSAT